jgi:hypothetical protein
MKNLRIITILVLISVSGCEYFFSDCKTWVPQKWHLGNFEAEMVTNKPILKVGDTIYFKFELDRYLFDIDSLQMDIDLGVEVFNKITTTANYSDTTHSDFFATDTTIFKVFDQYFDLTLNKGRFINAYTFDCELNGDAWELEIQYILKKPGNYTASVQPQEIRTSQAELEEGTCMQGFPKTFNARIIWKESDYNMIGYLFNDDKEKYPDYFGFIVEE